MKITQDQVNKIQLIMFDMFGKEEPEFRPNYVGRFMHGRDCVGFVVAAANVVALGAAIGMAFGDDIDELGLMMTMMTNAQTDDMAYDKIVYFPGVTFDR